MAARLRLNTAPSGSGGSGDEGVFNDTERAALNHRRLAPPIASPPGNANNNNAPRGTWGPPATAIQQQQQQQSSAPQQPQVRGATGPRLAGPPPQSSNQHLQ